MDISMCTAYDDFKSDLQRRKGNYSVLNNMFHPRDGQLPQQHKPSEAEMEYIRGGIVSVMATWEAFMQDIMQEALDIVIDSAGKESSEMPFKCLFKRWPDCEKVVKRSLKNRISTLNPETVAYDLLLEREQAEDPHWSSLLKEYLESILRKVSPVFGGPNGIDGAFSKFFCPETKLTLSNRIIALGEISYDFRINKSSTSQIKIDNVDTLIDTLRLYYGIRCILAHGKPAKTDTGVFKEFPKPNSAFHKAQMLFEVFSTILKSLDESTAEKHKTLAKDLDPYINDYAVLDVKTIKAKLKTAHECSSSSDIKMILKEADNLLNNDENKFLFEQRRYSSAYGYWYLYRAVYLRARNYGRETWVNYFTLVNLNEFLDAIARRLMLAIAEWLQKVEISAWGYQALDVKQEEEYDSEMGLGHLYSNS